MGSTDLELRRQVEDCRQAHARSPYYADAERHLPAQWDGIIQPFIRGADFSRVLELAPGHGRNTERLRAIAREIHLVDVNESCIAACRARFGAERDGCRFSYHVGDGVSLAGIADASITFVYSWDSVVHFEPAVIRAYLDEFARVLVPGGRGFIHHSNYGALAQPGPWRENPHWRSDMSAEAFAAACADAGLAVERQQLLDWEIEDLDCLTLFSRRA